MLKSVVKETCFQQKRFKHKITFLSRNVGAAFARFKETSSG